MKIIQVIDQFDPKMGGVYSSVSSFSDAFYCYTDIDVGLMSRKGVVNLGGGLNQIDFKKEPKIKLQRILNFSQKVGLSEAYSFENRANTVLHVHGLWSLFNHKMVVQSVDYGIPTCIQLHGMLLPAALKFKKNKKLLALALYQKKDLANASLIVATSEIEMISYRELGFKNPVAIIPNGISFENIDSVASTVKNSQKITTSKDRVAIFLGRIHPIKGIEKLILAWHMTMPIGWTLLIAGSGDQEYYKKLEKLVFDLNLTSVVTFLGLVENEEKSQLLKLADLLILPSLSENFGMVVVEALAARIPVIATKGTPWSDLESYHCGWWVEQEASDIASAITEATSLLPNALQNMGDNGYALVRDKYSMKNVVLMYVSAYNWILGLGDRPDFIIEN